MKRFFMVAFLAFSVFAFGQEAGAKYLIITHDNYYDAILPFAQWKHKKGMRAKVVKLSETGSSSAEIRTYILNAYNTWPVRPEYLLLVGAPNYITMPLVGSTRSDNYYTDMDADVYNEILSGRLTVHSTTEAQTVVAKMLRYERTPDTTDSLWFRKACLIVNQDNDPDDTLYWNDTRYVAAHLVSNGYVQIDTLCDAYGHTSTDVINRTNAGRDFVVYRGSGTNNWFTPFGVNPDLLANGNKLPIVVSATCNTLGTGSTPAAAERWFLTGSPTTLRGASGYFATSTSDVNIAYLRSAVTRGFFDGIFQYRYRTFGQACEQGRLRVYQQYPGSGGLDEYYGFTTVGDPEMNIWTATPKPILVTHDSSIYAGVDETLQVSVQYQGAPVDSALVCLHYDTLVYSTAYTDAAGNATFTLNVPVPGMMDLTVTGRNLRPYEGSVYVITGSAYLAYTGSQIDDTLGNNNGYVNPGETILLWATVKNFGSAPANGILGYLRTPDTLVNITDSVVHYGDFPAGVSFPGRNPFVFDVSINTHAHPIVFTLLLKSAAGDTWPNVFTVNTSGANSGGGGTGPDAYGYYMYDDTDSATGNAPVYSWTEIAPPAGGPGTIISQITNDNDDTVTVSLPFTFKYYGINYSTIGVCTNGFAELGGATSTSYTNYNIPYAGNARRFAAAFWDNLNPGTMQMGHGDIFQYYDSANHRWILEFYQVALQTQNHPWETFQLIVRDPQYYPTPTGDGEMVYQYQSIAEETGCTAGIEDETETRGLQYVYNAAYDANAAPLQNGRAILVTTKPPVSQVRPWLHVIDLAVSDSAGGNNNGIIEPNEVIAIALTVQNDGDTMVAAVNGTLRVNSTFVTLLDSLSAFGDLSVGASSNNQTDPYQVQIAASPADTVVGFTVRFTGNSGAYEAFAYFTLFIAYDYSVGEANAPEGLPFLRIQPNPCRPPLRIMLSPATNISGGEVLVYDVTGRTVRRLAGNGINRTQAYEIMWDGRDDQDRPLPAGVYFIRAETGALKAIKKMVLVR